MKNNKKFNKSFNLALKDLHNDPTAFSTFAVHVIQVFEIFAEQNNKTVNEILEKLKTVD